ncbi:glycosyltransferase [Aporhodopirellula aestuarii]|uniref:Glycosyltransferase n=1 Tax=Aporhodopirellula aestuarii TaxID=2950107 RepID=A0ABT0U5K0_9BACT|nr:glycosyltransferase [Aporhodopirellula aestuarii]MCM2372207.1 glycosyltransferase [Aporhodopirellula aestuarii]
MSIAIHGRAEGADRRNAEFRKSIVLGSTQSGWGGGEVYLMALAKGLRDRGADVHFVARSNGSLHDNAVDEGFPVRTLDWKGRNPFQLWGLRRWLCRESFSIVHCNDSHCLTGLGVAAKGIGGLSVIGIRHTMFPIRSVFKYSRVADRVICVSHAVADACRQRGVMADKLSVIHAAISRPNVSSDYVAGLRCELLPDASHKLIVAVGNLLECKGHEALIRSAHRLKQDGLKVRTVIAGEGDQREHLESLIRELGLNDDVRLLGFRNDAESLIAAADVVAHPSYNEGLCLTVAAAMMLRRPIVSTAVGGLRDVLGIDPRMQSDGPYACVFEAGDESSLSNALHNQLADPTNAESLDDACQFAINRFTTARMVDATIGLYSELRQPKVRAA